MHIRRIKPYGGRKLTLRVLQLVLLGERPAGEEVGSCASARSLRGAGALKGAIDVARIKALLRLGEEICGSGRTDGLASTFSAAARPAVSSRST
jgi:hypothetical protein